MTQGQVPVDVWIGADGLVHQLALKMSIDQVGGQHVGATVTATETFDHFGEPVDVQAPPADQVGSLSSLSDLFGSGH
jgi:hypothetical protein